MPMVIKIWSQKNTTSKEESHRWWIYRLKKIFSYLLFLSIVQWGTWYTQSEQPKNMKDIGKIQSAAAVTDHNKLIDTNADSLDIDTIRNELLMEINAERTNKGLKPLVLDDDLNEAAMKYTQYMNANSWYHHQDKNWGTWSARAKNAGYKKVFMWENIHDGPRSISYVMQEWIKSAFHENNILWEFTEDIGIGYENGYRVLDFGGRYPWIQKDDVKK